MAQTKTKKNAPRRKRTTWTEEHLALRRLMEEELHGLLHYLRSIHCVAIVLVIASIATMIYGMSVLFQNDHSAVVAFLVMIATALFVAIVSAWSLHPWILPRFLLPMDMNTFDLDELKALFKDPEEYLKLLKTHTQILTDQFLIPKLKRLRNAVALFVFGMATAIILAIALP